MAGDGLLLGVDMPISTAMTIAIRIIPIILLSFIENLERTIGFEPMTLLLYFLCVFFSMTVRAQQNTIH